MDQACEISLARILKSSDADLCIFMKGFLGGIFGAFHPADNFSRNLLSGRQQQNMKRGAWNLCVALGTCSVN